MNWLLRLAYFAQDAAVIIGGVGLGMLALVGIPAKLHVQLVAGLAIPALVTAGVAPVLWALAKSAELNLQHRLVRDLTRQRFRNHSDDVERLANYRDSAR